LYIKNTSDNDLVIEALAFGLKSSTGGSSLDLPEATVIRNPTAGTIVSNETETDINANRNHGDSGNFDGLAFKGATGNTMTDGSELLFIYLGQSGRSFITINEILPKGTSLGVKIKPQASNTSQVLYCAAIVYFAKKEI
jgi:archaellin